MKKAQKEEEPENARNETVNCLEIAVLFTNSISSYGLLGQF